MEIPIMRLQGPTMAPYASLETSGVLRAFQVLAVAAPTAFYAATSIASSFAIAKITRKNQHGLLHNAQLAFSCFVAVLSAAEAAVGLKRSDPVDVSDPEAVYALFLTLVYIILLLGLLDNNSAASYPHYGSWAILLVCEGIAFALYIPLVPDGDYLLFTRSALQGLQLAALLLLLVGSLSFHYLKRNPGTPSEDETQPLLQNEDLASAATETKEPDNDEVDRVLIRSRPFWQYVASFKVFVPFMYPRSPKLQLYFLGVCISSALTRVVTIALPLVLGALINRLGDSVPWGMIVLFVMLRFLLSAAGISLVEVWLEYRVNVDMTVALQRHCYAHIMSLSAEFHDSKKSSVVWEIMSQGQDVIDLLHDLLFSFIPETIDMVSGMIVLSYLFGPYMAFVVTSTAVLFYWLAFRSLATKRSLRRTWLDSYHDQYYQMTESTSNWSTVSYFGRVPYEIERYGDKCADTRNKMLAWWAWEFWTRGVRHALPCLTFLAACAVAALQIAHKQRNPSDFVVLMTYWAQLTGPLSSIAGELSRLTQKLVNAEKLCAVLEKTPRVQDSSTAQPFKYLQGAVDFENVSFAYDGKRQVVKGINFRAAPGKTIALVGQTGGGKSTILKLLFRFYDVEHGRVLIDGQDVRQITMESFRKHIAMVPQNPVVFNMTILDNVRYPDVECTDEEVINACKAAALHDKIMTFTRGYQEKVGERGTKLSGGELQRLAIARAMLKRADILLLDEATSSVDSITEKVIQASIRQLCAGKTSFVIAHRLSTILHADQILVIRDGQIVEAGTHEILIKHDGAYQELWRSQIQSLNAAKGGPNSPSRSRSREPVVESAAVLINDLSTSDEDAQALVKRLARNGVEEDAATHGRGATDDSSNVCNSKHRSHGNSHEGQDRNLSKRLAHAMNQRLSRSRSPAKNSSSDFALNPDAPTFRLSRSKSPEKDRPSETVMNPEVQTFRLRRYQDGNHSSTSGENIFVADGPMGGFIQHPSPLMPSWKDSDCETPSPAPYPCNENGGEIARGCSTVPDDVGIDEAVQLVSGNIHRRQAASEPCPENLTEADESEEEAEVAGIMHYSRLPQMSRARVASAMGRKTTKETEEQEDFGHEEEPHGPVNTTATSPGILTPRTKQQTAKGTYEE
jgi:ABC-type transport system involved in Fe-S cluster assembly fused permease/ATPase subunit